MRVKSKCCSKVVFAGLMLGILTFFPLFSNQKSTVDESSTLDDLLRYAASNNPQLAASFHRWKEALERIIQQKSLPNPNLTLSYYVNEVETRVGPQRGILGIRQMFPWFGKLKLRGDMAAKEAEAEWQAFQHEKLKLFYSVKSFYVDYHFLRRRKEILGEQRQWLEYLEGIVDTRYRAGKVSYSDLMKVQIEKAKIEDQLRSVRELENPVKSQLNSVLNRPPDAVLPVHTMHSPGVIGDTLEQLGALMKSHNPRLQMMDKLVHRAAQGIRLAKKSYFPDLSVGLNYIVTDESPLAGVTESGKDPLMVTAQFQIPLWFSRNRAMVSGAFHRHKAALFHKREIGNQLQSRLELVFFQYRDADSRSRLYRESLLPRARQSLRVAQTAYQAAEIDILNVIDTQRSLLDLELIFEKSLAEQSRRLAELELLVGKPLGD